MPPPIERFEPDYIPAPLANKLLGLHPPKIPGARIDPRRRPLTQDEINHVARQTDSRVLRLEDEVAQVNELYLIRRIADQIEGEFRKRNMPLPTVYGLHTGKIPNPFPNAEVIGRYAEDKPLEFIPATDIFGHSGEVSVSMIDDKHSYMAWLGRGEHTYEWLRHRYGDIVASRKMNVIKELIRRQREEGKNPVIINTQLAGTAEGSPIGPGDLGIIVEDFEEGPNLLPGIGHNAFFDKFLGSRFQPKWGRSLNEANLALARKFLSITQKLNIGAGPMGIIGDAEASEFESWFNYARSINTFRTALELGFAEFAKKVFEKPEKLPDIARNTLRFFLTFRQNWLTLLSSSTPEDARLTAFQKVLYSFRSHEPSLGWGMGNSLEPANLRRLLMKPNPVLKNVIINEPEIPTLNLAVITDFGGPHTSPKAGHEKFIAKAEARAPVYAEALKEIALALAHGEVKLPPVQYKGLGFSLESQMFVEAQEHEERLEDDAFPKPLPIPTTLGYVHRSFIQAHINLLEQKAQLYRTFGYPVYADVFVYGDPEFAVTVENLREVQESLRVDGKTAYDFFVALRDRQLRAAQGRLAKIETMRERPIPREFIASDAMTEEFLLKRRKSHLHQALWHESAARIIAQQYSNYGVTHEMMAIETE